MTQFTKGSKIRFEGMRRNGGAMIFNGSSSIILIAKQKQWMELPPNFGGKAAAREAATSHGVAIGRVSFEAVKAHATSVPDEMFAPLADYFKMSMPGMGKPPERRREFSRPHSCSA